MANIEKYPDVAQKALKWHQRMIGIYSMESVYAVTRKAVIRGERSEIRRRSQLIIEQVRPRHEMAIRRIHQEWK